MDASIFGLGNKNDGGQHLHGPTLSLLIGLAAIGALLYARFIYNPANAGNIDAYGIVLIAESLLLLQALIALWTILSGGFNPRDFDYHTAKRKLLGAASLQLANRYAPLYIQGKPTSTDVFVTVYGEPLSTIKRTVTAARDLIGIHQTLYSG